MKNKEDIESVDEKFRVMEKENKIIRISNLRK
jgi:hypothetical protein